MPETKRLSLRELEEWKAKAKEVDAMRAEVARLHQWVSALHKDKERIDKLEKILTGESRYHDVVLQQDEEDGVWVALRETGLSLSGCITMAGQDAHSGTLRDAIDAIEVKA
jgi:hypothetical protein